MSIHWNFYKIYLKRTDIAFQERKKILVDRFKFSAGWDTAIRSRKYSYDLSDVKLLKQRDIEDSYFVSGYIFRSPKLARGRTRAVGSKVSEKASVDVESLSDSSEFIYDLDTCVLALRVKDPFFGTKSTVAAWIHLLGETEEDAAELYDVYVDLLRDSGFADSVFDQAGDLKYVKLNIAKNNPPGHKSFDDIDLGLILDESGSDEETITLKRPSPGSMDKSAEGLIRRTIKNNLQNGYLKSGVIQIDQQKIDLKSQSGVKARETAYSGRTEDGTEEPLADQAQRWIAELKSSENSDIFYTSAPDEGPEEQ